MHRAIGEATSSSGSSGVTLDGGAERWSKRNPVTMEAQELQFEEEELRREVSQGAEQARRFEQRFNAAAPSAATTSSSLIADAAAVLTTFTSIIKLLNRAGSSGEGVGASKQLAIGARLSSSPPRTRAAAVASSGSPIRSGAAITPPQSPHFTSTRSSPVMTTPEGSPGIAATSPATAAAGEDQGFDFPDARVPLSRKRKHQPRRVEKVRASSNEHGIEQPPEDGFTWRKYGQKDILNSRHPKSYYRCSFQKEMGCPAVKYVQKSEEEPGYFLVTYIADHTCKQQQPLGIWSATPTCTRLPTVATVASTSCAALSLTSSGGIQISHPSSYSTLEDITSARLSSSTMPIRPPMMAPRFGAAPCITKAEPFASSSTLASGSCAFNNSASLGLKKEKMEAGEGYMFQDKSIEPVVEGEGRRTDARSSEEIWPSLDDLGAQPIFFEDMII